MKKLYLFLPLFICSITFAQKKEFIDALCIDNQTITYHVNKEFHDKYLREDFFVTYQDDIDLVNVDPTILTMPLLMNTISMIWISGEDYYIDAMDKDLYHSLNIVHEVFRRFYPITAWNGRLIPRRLVDASKISKAKPLIASTAIPFSHGLDSLCTSLRHHQTPQLLMTVRGCPDTPLEFWDKNWDVTQTSITHFAQIHGHTTSFVISNFHEFFNWDVLDEMSPEITNWRMDTIEDLGWIGLAAPIVASHGIHKIVAASNEDWSTLHPGASCPLIDDSISFAGVSVTCDAFDVARPEKNSTIARICNEYNLEKPIIYVCEHILPGRTNCCECQKCAITILSFLLAGEDPGDYGFDIQVSDFLTYFKYQYSYENEYSPHRACWFKYAQLQARAKLDTFNNELQDFFSWFITINFDNLTIPNPQIDINYDNFRDLWDGIPENWHDARTALLQTHVAS